MSECVSCRREEGCWIKRRDTKKRMEKYRVDEKSGGRKMERTEGERER